MIRAQIRPVAMLIVLFMAIWIIIAYREHLRTPESIFQSDAAQYNAGAIHLLQSGVYSLDGVHPTIEREPGQSAFLAMIYVLFGRENVLGIFIVQGLLHLTASLLFFRQLRWFISERSAVITLGFLLLLPPVYHIIFSPNRESLGLSLFLLFSTAFLALLSRDSPRHALMAGISMGGILLTYIPFLFFPLFLLPCFRSISWRSRIIVFSIPMLFCLAWASRNAFVANQFEIVGSLRTTVMVYARAEQAEQVQGMDPLRCLVAEYVTRDWTGLPAACSTTYLFHLRWPEGILNGEEAVIMHDSIQKILRHPVGYLWFSVFEIIELHLPFVNSWGHRYNILASVGMAMLYAGFLVAGRRCVDTHLRYFVLVIVYTTMIFILTDATPRYLMPSLFAYAVIASVGYDHLLKRLHIP